MKSCFSTLFKTQSGIGGNLSLLISNTLISFHIVNVVTSKYSLFGNNLTILYVIDCKGRETDP